MKRYPFILLRVFCFVVALGLTYFYVPAAAAEPALPSVEVLVVAPHSDDEAIGCTAIIMRAVAEKRRVGIVVVTAGDGHVRAAAALAKKEVDRLVPDDFLALAALRQRHTLEAMPQLGVKTSDLYFLGYPDGGLTPMYETKDATPYRHLQTQRTATYGAPVADYHTKVHGTAAHYLKAAVIADLVEIVRERKPQTIYTTDEVDTHLDHRATFFYVRDAAKEAEFRGKLLTFVVHGKPPEDEPAVRIQLSPEELAKKRATIEIYQAGVSPVHDYLAAEYAREEEVFWDRSEAVRP